MFWTRLKQGQVTCDNALVDPASVEQCSGVTGFVRRWNELRVEELLKMKKMGLCLSQSFLRSHQPWLSSGTHLCPPLWACCPLEHKPSPPAFSHLASVICTDTAGPNHRIQRCPSWGFKIPSPVSAALGFPPSRIEALGSGLVLARSPPTKIPLIQMFPV